METLVSWTVVFIWLSIYMAGVVLANGFWSTFFAITTGGFWSFYLVVEKVLLMSGVI